MKVSEECYTDGIIRTPSETFNYLSRLLYHRRSKMNPLWNNVVVAGYDAKEGKPFLGNVDLIGTSFEADFCATGLGMHLALPILRSGWTEDMTEEQALDLLKKCMRTLFYRDCRTVNRITFATVTSNGPVVKEPVAIDTEWSYRTFVKP